MFEVVAIYDLLEERRINDVTVNFFIFFIIYGIVSDILALRFCATLLFFLHFDVTCDILLNKRRTATWNLFVK